MQDKHKIMITIAIVVTLILITLFWAYNSLNGRKTIKVTYDEGVNVTIDDENVQN